jgi:precorrin-6x reductase
MSDTGSNQAPGVLIFGGTREGRQLFAAALERGHRVCLTVASDYGREVAALHLPESSDPSNAARPDIRTGRLDAAQMADLIRQDGFGLLIDATHPYAIAASTAIREAATQTETLLVRLLRPTHPVDEEAVILPDLTAVLAYFQSRSGTILAAIGSKHLAELSQLPDFTRRVVARILPDPQLISQCLQLGLPGSRIIAMQGPFSEALNVALLRHFDCRYLLTKNSGEVGGFAAKAEAARAAGAQLVVLDRPTVEEGLDFPATLDLMDQFIASQSIGDKPWKQS